MQSREKVNVTISESHRSDLFGPTFPMKVGLRSGAAGGSSGARYAALSERSGGS